MKVLIELPEDYVQWIIASNGELQLAFTTVESSYESIQEIMNRTTMQKKYKTKEANELLTKRVETLRRKRLSFKVLQTWRDGEVDNQKPVK